MALTALLIGTSPIRPTRARGKSSRIKSSEKLLTTSNKGKKYSSHSAWLNFWATRFAKFKKASSRSRWYSEASARQSSKSFAASLMSPPRSNRSAFALQSPEIFYNFHKKNSILWLFEIVDFIWIKRISSGKITLFFSCLIVIFRLVFKKKYHEIITCFLECLF